jgi:hypothetical protein
MSLRVALQATTKQPEETRSTPASALCCGAIRHEEARLSKRLHDVIFDLIFDLLVRLQALRRNYCAPRLCLDRASFKVLRAAPERFSACNLISRHKKSAPGIKPDAT